MEDAFPLTFLPDNVDELKHLLVAREQQLAQQAATIATLTQQHDAYYLEKLRLEVRLAKGLKQAYGPRADRISDPGQLLLDFGELLDALVTDAADRPTEPDEGTPRERPASRRLRTRGRRDIATLDHLPLIEQTYELTDELCRYPTCQAAREKIGTAISYTIEYLPGSFVRVKHVQHKYACRACEQNGDYPPRAEHIITDRPLHPGGAVHSADTP
jgi:transposase